VVGGVVVGGVVVGGVVVGGVVVGGVVVGGVVVGGVIVGGVIVGGVIVGGVIVGGVIVGGVVVGGVTVAGVEEADPPLRHEQKERSVSLPQDCPCGQEPPQKKIPRQASPSSSSSLQINGSGAQEPVTMGGGGSPKHVCQP